MMQHFIVVTPEMSEVVPVTDYGEGPTEYFRLSVPIEARTASEAKVFAIYTPELSQWVIDARSDGLNPLCGLEVVSNLICSHGMCHCGCVDIDCAQCINEAEAAGTCME